MYITTGKRLFDIIFSIVGLLLILPFFPIIALFIRFDSKGPALIRLIRISEGREIKVFKFRTMIIDAHHIKISLVSYNERIPGPFFKMRNDPRVTKVGKILRRFRIDEFPQLINVIYGDLSLVGPRPHEPLEVAQYPSQYKFIPLAKSGVTGYSQIRGASSLPFMQELELDSQYLENQSLFFDIKIIIKTLSIILFDHNAV